MPDVAPLQIELFPSQDRPDMSYPTKKGNPPALKAANGSDILEAKSPEFVNFTQWPSKIETNYVANAFIPPWYQYIVYQDGDNQRYAVVPFANNQFQNQIGGIGSFSFNDMPNNRLIKECPGSGKVRFGEDVHGTRIFEVPWDEQEKYASALMGGYSGMNADGMPIIYLPDIFSSSYPFLFCQEVDIDPVDSLNRGLDQDYPRRIQYERARITATYRPLEHETTLQTAGQIFTLKGSQWHWAGTSLADIASGKYVQGEPVVSEQAFSKIIANGEVSLTKRMFFPTAIPSLMSLLGCCNSSPFLGFGTGTLQLVSLEGKPSFLPNSMPIWRVHMKFLFNPQTHLAMVSQSGTTLAKAGNGIAAKLRNSAQIGKDALAKVPSDAIDPDVSASTLQDAQNALAAASIADFVDGTPLANEVAALNKANSSLATAGSKINGLRLRPGLSTQAAIAAAQALRGVGDTLFDQSTGIGNDITRLSQTKIQKILPGYQFVRLTSSVAGVAGFTGNNILLDLNGNTINGGGDMGAKVQDLGLIHKVADFNVLLNYL